MIRRLAVCMLLIGFAASFVGCNASFWPTATTKKLVDSYQAVSPGMSEKQVVKLLGEPTNRRGITLEGSTTRATTMTWVGTHKLITVTMVRGQVVGKQKI